MRRLWLTSLTLAASLWLTSSASAQLEAQLSELNAQALEAYQALDLETARRKLEEALGLAQQANYVGPEVAQSFMNLGVVFVAGMGDRDQGLSAFLNAMCMQPDVQLDPLLSTPDVQAVFAQAQQDAQRGACGPAPMQPMQPMQPPYMPGPSTAPPSVMGTGPQNLDEECPPGVICEPGTGEGSQRKDFARFFFNLQFALGFAYVSSGMEADSRPPPSEVFAASDFFDTMGQPIDTDGDGNGEDFDGDGVPDAFESTTFIDRNLDGQVDQMDTFDFDLNGVPDDFNGDGRPDNRFYFDDRSAWVPDADSFDDYQDTMLGIPRGQTPVVGNCSADGKPSGPLDPIVLDQDNMPFTTLEPSKYCVRVEQPGVIVNPALRLNVGYMITEQFALSMPFRFQFNAGEGSFSHMLIGLRAEFLFSKMKTATGFPVSFFLGATYGQIQAQPKPKDPLRKAPFVISGPVGAHLGFNIRWRIIRNFGLILSPELDFQFPDFMFNGDLSLGVEGAL